MNEELAKAKIELEQWLSHPNELGRKPIMIKYTNSFKDEDGINCVIFKYKKEVFGKWLLGISSDSGAFSEMKEYNQNTEIEDSKKILEMLKKYWEERAKQI